MKPVFETCYPRDEVLRGELRDAIFAARLKDVMDGVADPVYQNAGRFFENTYPTNGMKTLVKEVFGRLSGRGKASSPFIRLETSFGGGKTHNLIALRHLANAEATDAVAGWISPDWLPDAPVRTVGVVGSDLDSANGVQHGDLVVRTLWGEIAWQLGGAEGHALVRGSEQTLSGPGTGFLEQIIGEKPALIMIDEIGRHLRTAKATPTVNGESNLAEQTVAFLMSLIEFAASRHRVSVVLTLSGPEDAFAQETDNLRQSLIEAQKVSSRQERVITPTGDDEIAHILAHRLYTSIDREAAAETAAAYAEYHAQLGSRGMDVPQRALRAEYGAEIARSYPFHPELLSVLHRRVATIPNFQQTRGALRLLALIVRRLWETRPADAWLIAPHHVDLLDSEIAEDLTARLQRPMFRNVIDADVAVHCQAIDEPWVTVGKPPYAQRTATSVFLHSLAQGGTGVDLGELALAVLQPGDDPELMRKAIAFMLAEGPAASGLACWFLHFDGQRYRFKTEPSLEKVVQDEMANIGLTSAKNHLDARIADIWKKGAITPVWKPNEAVDLDDDAGAPKLAIIHYDAATSTAEDKKLPDLVVKLFRFKGTQEAFRTYQNNVLFLVADDVAVGRMVEVAQRYLAVQRIVTNGERLREFPEEQQKRIKGMQDDAELQVRIAITRAYRYLYYPSPDVRGEAKLARHVMPAESQGEPAPNQMNVILRALKDLEKTLTADDPSLPAAYVKAKAWPHGAQEITTEDLRREFAKRHGVRMVLDLNQLKRTIRDGARHGEWIYYNTREQVGYGPPSPEFAAELSDDAILYLPDEATKRGIPIKGTEPKPTETCPLCGQDPCICGPEPPKPDATIRADGVPAQAFQQVADQCHDQGVGALASIRFRVEGKGTAPAADARALGLAIPQLGRGEYKVEEKLTAEFAHGNAREQFTMNFSGSWNRYKRLKQVADAFGQEASDVNVSMTVLATFDRDGLPVAGDEFQAIREIFTTLGVNRIALEAKPRPPKD